MRRIKIFALFSFFFGFFVLFSCISLWRYNTGQVFYYDFGHFARIIWLISRFLPPIIDHKVLGEIHFFGDHFSPSIYLLSPLFWLSASPKILLFQQALATTITGFLIFMIARRERLSTLIGIIIAFVFLLFAGTENPLVSDWHSEPTAAVFLLLFIYWFFYSKRKTLAILCALIFVGFKDSNALSLCFALVPFFLVQKKRRKEILIIICLSLVWFTVVSFILTPSISKKPYLYTPTLPQNPLTYITNYFNLPIKRDLIFYSFASFGFLPLLSATFLIPIFAELGIRLIPIHIHSQDFTLGMHYNVFLAVFLAISTIKSLVSIRFFTRKKILKFQTSLAIAILIIALYTAKKITHPPLLLAINPVFWNQWNTKAQIFDELDLIPTQGTVMGQNNFLPHLVQRKEKIYLLSLNFKRYMPQTIAFDLAPGQNINNYYSGEIRDIEQVVRLKDTLLLDKNYERIATPYKDFYLFRVFKSFSK